MKCKNIFCHSYDENLYDNCTRYSESEISECSRQKRFSELKRKTKNILSWKKIKNELLSL